ncbi:S8 family serine peptidase [Pelagicoccus sp. SDUM812003]|uniref:S8 family serine peptidase n=1 Tax=Pelagicoccus sp. SDUM812003 TaxID=3041267 RepID=UPI00280FE8DE|nr:S8 family serine peptidase [Pelagicoccus sp. SDUM812003]MDQ8202921.1 S8 family serine peptidase [Pelagicoccus sp. SDUM812003]
MKKPLLFVSVASLAILGLSLIFIPWKNAVNPGDIEAIVKQKENTPRRAPAESGDASRREQRARPASPPALEPQEVAWRDPRDWEFAKLHSETRHPSQDLASASYSRIRIVTTDGFDFPIRLEEAVYVDPNSNDEYTELVSAMAANRILLHSATPLRKDDVEQIAQALGWQLSSTIRSPFLAELFTTDFTADTVQHALESIDLSDTGIQVSANLIFYASAFPNDPSYGRGEQWALNHRQDNDIDAPEGWRTRTSAGDIIIAITDSGIRLDHEDLKANLWTNSREIANNGIDDDGNGYVDDVHGANTIAPSLSANDDNGHGTHVAGIAGAVGNNSIGIAGVAWDVNLMAVKCLNKDGQASVSSLVDGIDYAIENGAHIINASWGGYGFAPALRDAIYRAQDAGIFFVTAAGNDASSQLPVPAAYPIDCVVAVGAVDDDGERASYSNYGWRTLDVMAPGSGILSSWHSRTNAYASLSGTSMAAPLVSGTLALNLAQHPDSDIDEQIARLRASAETRPGLRYFAMCSGIVNLANSLEMIRIPQIPSITDSSEQSVTILEGESAKFRVTAESDIELAYQWYFEQSPLEGETNAALNLDAVPAESRGTYTVEVSNADGSVYGSFSLIVYPRVEAIENVLGSDIPIYASHEDDWQIVQDETDAAPYVSAAEQSNGRLAKLVLLAPSEGLLEFEAKLGENRVIGLVAEIQSDIYELELPNSDWTTGRLFLPYQSDQRVTVTYGTRLSTFTAPAGGLALRKAVFFQSQQAPPFIISHPSSRTVSLFSKPKLSCDAEGEDLNYQWFKDDRLIDGATSSTLELSPIQENDAGRYHALVTNPFGSAKSQVAELSIDDTPVPATILDAAYETTTLIVGESIELSREVVGEPPIVYQWYRSTPLMPTQPLPTSGPSLALGPVTEAHTGTYHLEVSNQYGSYRCEGHSITVVASDDRRPPRLSSSPEDQTIYAIENGSSPVLISIGEVLGTQSYQIKWFKDGVELPKSELGNLLPIRAPKIEDSGTYFAEISNRFGTITSHETTLHVLSSLNEAIDANRYVVYSTNDYTIGRIDVRSQSTVTRDGIDALEITHDGLAPQASEFHVMGTPPNTNVSFFWKSDLGTRLVVSRGELFSKTLVGTGQWQEFLFSSGELSQATVFTLHSTSGPVTAWVDQYLPTKRPAILHEIAHDLPALGSRVCLKAEITGPELALQWFKDDQEIPGANQRQLVIEEFSESDIASYHLRGSNSFGSAQTQKAQLEGIPSLAHGIGSNVDFAIEGSEFIDSSQTDPETGHPYFQARLENGQSVSLAAQASGPGVLVLDYQGNLGDASITIDGKAYALGDHSERGLSAYSLSSDSNTITLSLSGGSNTGWSKLYGIWTQSDPIITSQAEFYGVQIESFDNNEPPFIAVGGIEPLSLEWYRNGELILTESNQSSGIHRLFSTAPNKNQEGEYTCTVTDAVGATVESAPMSVAFIESYSAVLDAPIYSLYGLTSGSRYDYQDFVHGGSSLSIAGPFSDEQAPFQFSYNAKSLWMKTVGFDPNDEFSVSIGRGMTSSFPPPTEWTEVSISSDLDDCYVFIPSNDNPNARVLIDKVALDDRVRFEQQPMSHATFLGDSISLRAEALSPINPLSYRWEKNGRKIAGGEDGFLSIEDLSLDDLGRYQAIAIESAGGETYSEVATVSLLKLPFDLAIDFPGVRLGTWGHALWGIDESQSVAGPSCLRSGEIGNGQESGLRIEIDGPAIAGYYIKGDGFELDEVERAADWTFRPLGYIAAGESRAFNIRVKESNDEPAGEPSSAYQAIDRLIISPLAAYSYEQWRSDLGSQHILAPSSHLGQQEDLDNDSIPNWLEYTFNLHPLRSDPIPAFQVTLSPSGEAKATLDYQLARSSASSMVFESSLDLVEWNLTRPTLTLQDSTENYLSYRAEIVSGNSSSTGQFFRWRLVRNGTADTPSIYLEETPLQTGPTE